MKLLYLPPTAEDRALEDAAILRIKVAGWAAVVAFVALPLAALLALAVRAGVVG